MPAWLPPLAAASLAVVFLNVAWLMQRRRAGWQRRFVLELRRWDGRVPEELERKRG